MDRPKQNAEIGMQHSASVVPAEMIYDWDLEADAIAWSSNTKDLLRFGDLSAIGTNKAFQERISVADLPNRSVALLRHYQAGVPLECTYHLRCGDGELRLVTEHGVATFAPDGEPIRIMGTLRLAVDGEERSARPLSNLRGDEVAEHVSRTLVREALAQALAQARRNDSPSAYLTVAIDNLSLINQTRGFDAGDMAILVVSQRLEGCLRGSDMVSRLGGGRFGVILNNCSEQDLASTGEKLLAAVRRRPVVVDNDSFPITVSIGGVSFAGAGGTLDGAMGKAEEVLRAARRSGRDCMVIESLDEERQADLHRSMVRAESVLRAMRTDSLRLAYQPIVDANTSEVLSYECLLRLEEDGKLISAGQFIPLVEQLGLVGLVDRHTLELAVEQLVTWPDLRLSLNVSALTATDSSWLRALRTIGRSHVGVTERLTIEITETAGLYDLGESARFVAAIKELGCQISLDDFGAGFTSFHHLKAMEVDVVKIDGSFVRGLAEDAVNQLFIDTLLRLAEGMGFKTVAECVESAEEALILIDHGVHYLQGYYFGVPTLDLEGLMKAEIPLPAAGDAPAIDTQILLAR